MFKPSLFIRVFIISTSLLIVSCAASPPKRLTNAPAWTQLATAVITPENIIYSGSLKVQSDRNTAWKCIDNQETVFEIGSLTKLFTAYITSKLVDRNELSLNSEIGAFIPEAHPNLSDRVLVQLLTHTAGVPFLPQDLQDMPLINSNPFRDYDRNRLIDYLRAANLPENSGEYLYSNLGYAIAGMMLELATDKSYESLLTELIAQPLELEQTSTSRTDVAGELAQGMNKDGSTTGFWDFEAFTPSGGVYSSVSDLSQFLKLQLNQELPAVARMQERHTANSGLAWQFRAEGGRQWLEQTGATGGFTSAALLNPSNRRAVIIVSNLSGLHHQAPDIPKLAEALLFQTPADIVEHCL